MHTRTYTFLSRAKANNNDYIIIHYCLLTLHIILFAGILPQDRRSVPLHFRLGSE